jgi:hypothetical protein
MSELKKDWAMVITDRPTVVIRVMQLVGWRLTGVWNFSDGCFEERENPASYASEHFSE